MLLWRTIKKNWYFFVIAFAVLAFSCRIWAPSYLIVPLPMKGFVDTMEMFMPFVLVLPVAFLLYDSFEIELGLTCGVKTTRLMFVKFASLMLYLLVAAFAMVALYQYEYFEPDGQFAYYIPFHMPDGYKIYLLVSVFVTSLFFASFYLFARVLTKNCYAPVGLGVMLYTIFHKFNNDIHQGTHEIKKCLFDPFLSNYVLGDKVLTEQYGLESYWTYNRLLFFGISVVFLIGTYFLLRREKLHQGFND